MKEKTIFPREEKSEVLFDKILNDPWAYNKLFQTFCNNLFCNDDSEAILSPLQFTEALFNCYSNKDLSAFLMAITQNTMFDLLRNSFLIPYRFNADERKSRYYEKHGTYVSGFMYRRDIKHQNSKFKQNCIYKAWCRYRNCYIHE